MTNAKQNHKKQNAGKRIRRGSAPWVNMQEQKTHVEDGAKKKALKTSSECKEKSTEKEDWIMNGTMNGTMKTSPKRMKSQVQLETPKNHALLVDFLYREVFGIWDVKESEGPHNQQRVVDFFKSFFQLEKLIIYGLLLSLDSFLYVFTYLPLRIILALGSGVLSIVYKRYVQP